MTEQQLQEYRELVAAIDQVFLDKKASLHGAINALSYMSVDIAVRNDFDEKQYMKDIKIMYKEQKTKWGKK
jgi:hypothetical protein